MPVPKPASMFQHTAARRRLVSGRATRNAPARFNTQPPEGGWQVKSLADVLTSLFQHTAARRRLGSSIVFSPFAIWFQHTAARRRLAAQVCSLSGDWSFNTQPPEGGWLWARPCSSIFLTFQHTAARRRLGSIIKDQQHPEHVSTHSRPKAAGCTRIFFINTTEAVSTHSRPKAAGLCTLKKYRWFVCFNTQPPEGGWTSGKVASLIVFKFQHTAARRRLATPCRTSRPRWLGFNTQPPEGGWARIRDRLKQDGGFNTQPPEGGWLVSPCFSAIPVRFQHTAARRRLVPR